MREKVQNYLKNLREIEESEEILYWDGDNLVYSNLEEFLNKEEPDDNDLREKE